MTFYAFIGALEQGLVYGLLTIGVYLTFRVLDFPDLTVDGSLPLGAAVSAACITHGLNPWLSLMPAMCAGFLAGMLTGILTTQLKILHLLASILTMTALYSINIRILGSRPNIPLINSPTVFDPVRSYVSSLGWNPWISSSILFFGIAIVVVMMVIWVLRTEFGQALLATGDNPALIRSLGVNTSLMIVLGVGMSNSIVALCGALVAQNQGAAEVGMGTGSIIAGLASIVVGETLFNSRKVAIRVVSAVLGSIAYRLAIALALSLNFFKPSDMNLITSTIVVLALALPIIKSHFKKRGNSLNAPSL
ncbi:MAG: ABC transporter permease [Deltaproteobacteria bacterium]|nr:ABC transporter permease [Deltaproteobacteria bacterium]